MTTETTFKPMVSKFNGICRNCEKPIEAGTEILWKPGMAIHPACEATMPNAEQFTATENEQPKQPVQLPRIPDGTYTVIFEDGTHQTIKFSVPSKGNFAGRRICSFLSGSDNESDYTGFAFVTGDNRLHTWTRFQHYNVRDRVMEAVRILYKGVRENGEEAFMAAGEAYAVKSGKCSKCNRKLTVPASIHRGIGPECAKKEW